MFSHLEYYKHMAEENATQDRISQEEAGIEYFIWDTAHDERVCKFCKNHNGKIYSWKEGANGIYPGFHKCKKKDKEDCFCRCCALAVILDDDEEKKFLIKQKDGSYKFIKNKKTRIAEIEKKRKEKKELKDFTINFIIIIIIILLIYYFYQ